MPTVMSERYVVGDTRIWTDIGAWTAAEIAGIKQAVVTYDSFGREAVIRSEEVPEPMGIIMLMLDTGQLFPVGAETQILTVRPGDAKPTLRRAADMTDKMHYAWMPSRKIRLSLGTVPGGNVYNSMPEEERLTYLMEQYNTFTEDNIRPAEYQSMVYMEPKSFEQFRATADIIGLYGCAIRAREADHRIEVDPMRPSCFATKLLTGRADDPEDFINDLIDSHIVNPALPFGAMVDTAIRTGVICEGESHEGLRTLLPALNTGKRHKVFRITTVGEATTVDTPWIKL